MLQRTISHVNEPARRSAQSMSNYLTGSATRRSAATWTDTAWLSSVGSARQSFQTCRRRRVSLSRSPDPERGIVSVFFL